jgi:hypothetical protein
VHAVQIEINRGLYLNELTLRPTAGFSRAAARPAGLAAPLFTELPALLDWRAAASEKPARKTCQARLCALAFALRRAMRKFMLQRGRNRGAPLERPA